MLRRIYDPDPLRFYLTAIAPETHDTEFSWGDFVERNSNELVSRHSHTTLSPLTASWGRDRMEVYSDEFRLR